MAAAASYDWIFLAMGWTLAAIGAALLLRALFRDRSRGRRRCPKCWYDMSGVPGLQCPECGRAVSRESRLLKTRRRWRRAAAAAALVAIGLGIVQTPRVRRGGWTAAIPSSVLVFIAPLDPPSTVTAISALSVPPGPMVSAWPANQTLGPVSVTIPASPAPSPGIRERVCDELWKRAANHSLARWQEQVFARRWLLEHPQYRSTGTLRLPARWPVGRSVPVLAAPAGGSAGLLTYRWKGGNWQPIGWDPLLNIGRGGPALSGRWVCEQTTLDAGIEVGGIAICTESGVASITIVQSPADALDHDASEASGAAVLAALRPRLVRVDGRLGFEFRDRSDEPVWRDLKLGVFFKIELRGDGYAIARGTSHADWWGPVGRLNEWTELSVFPDAHVAPGLAERLELVITGDADAAGTAWCEIGPHILTPPACWTGRLVVPVARIEERPARQH